MNHTYFCNRCGQVYSYAEYLENRFCNKCGTFLQKRTRPRETKYWLFQANPETFRIFNWWKDHPDEETITWSIRQYADELRKGDRGIIWLSGDKSGIYALVDVVTNPSWIAHTEEEKSYWSIKTELYKISRRSVLKYLLKLFENPISRNFCLEDEVLSGLTILKQAQGTVFRITREQWERIHSLVVK